MNTNFPTPSPMIISALLTAIALQTGCQTVRPNTAAGGLFGTAAGSLVGAAIGAHDGKAGEGALIGGLAGGSLGALAGNQADRANDRDERQYYAALAQAQAAAITMDQVVQMSRSGISDDVIANQIQRQGIVSSPTPNDLILLKQNGVSNRVIQSLQSARPAGRPLVPAPAAVVYQPDVIYAEPFCPGPPLFYQPTPMHFEHFPGRRGHRHEPHIGFAVGF